MLNSPLLRQTDATLIMLLNIEMFSSDVTPVRIMPPLSKIQTDTIELCNCSFHIQLNLIN